MLGNTAQVLASIFYPIFWSENASITMSQADATDYG